jgi:putative ABC transport system substrate-binding protein
LLTTAGMLVIPAPVLQPNAINRAIEDLAREPNGAVLVLPDSFTAVHRERIVGLVAQHRLPAIYPLRYFVTSGGLMSYGADLIGLWRGVGRYVDRILDGANPGDLPVQSSTTFELVINLRVARAIGLEVPASLLAGAEEVID